MVSIFMFRWTKSGNTIELILRKLPHVRIKINLFFTVETVEANNEDDETLCLDSSKEDSTDNFGTADNDTSSSEGENCHRRISSRSNKGIPPKRFAYKALITNEPISYKEATECVESKKRLLAMQEEINAMNCNESWHLIELPLTKWWYYWYYKFH